MFGSWNLYRALSTNLRRFTYGERAGLTIGCITVVRIDTANEVKHTSSTGARRPGSHKES
jgi:hypothetical protein